MKYFAFTLLLGFCQANPFQVQVKNGGAYTVVAYFEYYNPPGGIPGPQTSCQWAAAWGKATTFTFPANAVNMSVRMHQKLGPGLARTLRRQQYDCEEEIHFGGKWITSSHKEHTGNGQYTEANHGKETKHEKHVFRWASNPGYNFQIRTEGTWGLPYVAHIQCREQHGEGHFDSRVIPCPQGDESMEKILQTGTTRDSTKYYYGQRDEQDYDPNTLFGNRRFVRCHDPRPAETHYRRFPGTSYHDIVLDPQAPHDPTPNYQDRLAWVEVPPLTTAERELEGARAQVQQLRAQAAAQIPQEQRARAIQLRAQAALNAQVAALQAQLAAIQEAAELEAEA